MNSPSSRTINTLIAPAPRFDAVYVLELGGEDDDFAACEAASAASDVEVTAPGLALAIAVSPDRVRGLAYTHRVSAVVGHTSANVERAVALLESAEIDRRGTVAVRARDVHGRTGVSTSRAERALGQVLVDRGFTVDLDDPDHELRALFSTDEGGRDGESITVCVLGWLVAESVRDFGLRMPTDRPFFQPGSMDPLLARALVNVAGAAPDTLLVDPMCGTGGLLVEAGLVGADVLGLDAQSKMVAGTATNLEHALGDDRDEGGTDRDDEPSRALGAPGTWAIARGDATRLPLRDDAADAVVFDAPYGRQSKIATHRLADLVSGALAEAVRIAPRAVVVADRSWDEAARAAGWTIEARFERRVHRSLTRYVLVLKR